MSKVLDRPLVYFLRTHGNYFYGEIRLTSANEFQVIRNSPMTTEKKTSKGQTIEVISFDLVPIGKPYKTFASAKKRLLKEHDKTKKSLDK